MSRVSISRYSLGSLFSAGLWPLTPLVSRRAEIFDKRKSTAEETLVAISSRTTDEVGGLTKENQALCNFTGTSLIGFYLSVLFCTKPYHAENHREKC